MRRWSPNGQKREAKSKGQGDRCAKGDGSWKELKLSTVMWLWNSSRGCARNTHDNRGDAPRDQAGVVYLARSELTRQYCSRANRQKDAGVVGRDMPVGRVDVSRKIFFELGLRLGRAGRAGCGLVCEPLLLLLVLPDRGHRRRHRYSTHRHRRHAFGRILAAHSRELFCLFVGLAFCSYNRSQVPKSTSVFSRACCYVQ